MNTNSFTDEQLLNLINETIRRETEHGIDDFTGGCIQVTTSHNNKITNYKIMLFFGYTSNRNPVTYSEDIEKDEYFIWAKAIMHKVESLRVLKIGSSIDKLNSRMNPKKEKDNIGNGIGKEVVGIGKGRTNIRTKPKHQSTFDVFCSQLEEIFTDKKIKTFKSKINKTKETKENFYAFEVVPDGIASSYADYVVRNKSKAARLDKYLLATIERNVDAIEYVQGDKQQSKKNPLDLSNKDYTKEEF